MLQQNHSESTRLDTLFEHIRSLESRLTAVEEEFRLAKSAQSGYRQGYSNDETDESDMIEVDKSLIESKVGEYGLAWLGSIVLLLGISFLMAFTSSRGFPALSTFTGYAAAAAVFILGNTLRKISPHLLFMLNISAHLLIYYVTLSLFFFSAHPVISQKGIVISLLLIAIGVQFYFALKQKSELLSGIALSLLFVTAVVSDSLHVTMPLIIIAALASLLFMFRFHWWRLMLVTLFPVYIVQLLWLFNNPVMGHAFEATALHPFNSIYLFICGAIFSAVALFEYKDPIPVKGVNAIVLLNAALFSSVILVVTAVYYVDHYIAMFAAIALFCIFFSVILKMITKSPFTPSFFACFGFFALSIMVYGFAKLPNVYFYLALQSFLVVSMALWFRSKIIVVMNSVLFLGIFLIYLVSATPVDRINFCFALVAFGTARILNLKKDRLTLKTDLMRNMYLFTLFFSMLYSCYHAFPSRYITLSWAGVAILFFIISLILHNIKYRWMAVGTLLATVVYLFIADLSHLEVGYRVIAFLVLAVILFSASLYYTKYIKKKRIHIQQEDR
jgi:hypothetical protein